jgi:hypothetical protein
LWQKPGLILKNVKSKDLTPGSLQHIDVLLPTHILEHLRPYGDTNFSQVRLLEEQHEGARLPNAHAAIIISWDSAIFSVRSKRGLERYFGKSRPRLQLCGTAH